MLREVLEGKSSLNVARRIYLNDLKLGVYVPRRMMLPQRKKKRFIDTDDSMLYPREKLERMQKYTKSLGSRKAKAKEQAGVEKRSPFSTFDPCANRLETLFSVYAEQSNDSYRRAAKGTTFLPPLTQTLKALNKTRGKGKQPGHTPDAHGHEKNNDSLPKLSSHKVL